MKQFFTKAILALSFIFLYSSTHAQIFEEHFDGGLPATWSAEQHDASPVNATSNWVFTTSGPAGGFATDPLASTTASNGWMLFDSDLNCNLQAQDVWLISPSFDCTNNDVVVVSFETYYRSFNDRVSLQVSADGGSNWTEYILFPNIVANDVAGLLDGFPNPITLNIPISDVAANQADVKIAFRFLSDGTTANGGNLTACGYAWQVDDVIVRDFDPTPFFDMRANINFFAIPPSIVTPASQVDEIGFLCDIENIGQMDASGVNLNASVTINGGATIYSQDLDYGTIPARTLDENRIFPDRYTPPASKEDYVIAYNITMDSTDANPDNNSISFPFSVSDSVFSKEFGSGTGNFSPFGNTTGQWTAANHYYVPNGEGFACTSVLFGINNASAVAGASLNIWLYEWDNVNNDSLVQRNEIDGTLGGKIVANSSYIISASDNNVQVVLENWDTAPDNQVRLKDDTHYILAIESTVPAGSEVVQIQGSRSFARDYSAMAFMNKALDIPRYGTFWNTSDIGNMANELSQINGRVTPRIRMHINPLMTVATNNQLPPENTVKVFPNPVNETLNLELDFVETFNAVNIKITDITGKELVSRDLSNIEKETAQFNTSNFAEGAYTLHVTTPNGVRTVRFVVAR